MNISKIKIGAQTFPMVLSMSAIEEILGLFGTMDEMSSRMESDDLLVQVRTIDSLLTILINAGIRYCKAMGIDTPPELDFDPADVIDIRSTDVVKAMKEAMIASQKTTIEAREPKGKNSKNAETLQGRSL